MKPNPGAPKARAARLGRDAEHPGRFGGAQAVPGDEEEHLALVLGEASHRRPELIAPRGCIDARIDRRPVTDVVGGPSRHGCPATDVRPNGVARDPEQPGQRRARLMGLDTQPGLDRGDEDVAEQVISSLTTDAPGQEPVYRNRVALKDDTQQLGTDACGGEDLGVLPVLRCPLHAHAPSMQRARQA